MFWGPFGYVFVSKSTFSEATALNESDINSDFEEFLNGCISSDDFHITLQGNKNSVDTDGYSSSDDEQPGNIRPCSGWF